MRNFDKVLVLLKQTQAEYPKSEIINSVVAAYEFAETDDDKLIVLVSTIRAVVKADLK